LALATFIPSLVHPDEIGLEFGDHGQDVEQQPPDRISRVVDGAADVELDAGLGEFFDDVAGIGQRPRDPVKLGNHQGVAGVARGEGLTQSGPRPDGAGQAVVDVDPVRLHPETGKGIAWGVRSWSSVEQRALPDEHPGHRMTVAVEPPSLACLPVSGLRTL